MMDWSQSDLRDHGFPELRSWKLAEFRERWAADLRDRWLWKRWATSVFCPMVAADAVLAVVDTTKRITPHHFETCSELVNILCVITWMVLSGRARQRRSQIRGS